MKFFKKDPFEESFMRLAENELYEIVANEVLNEQVMAGIWGRAFSDAEGNTEKSKALYIKYRVQDLKDRSVVELAKSENQKNAKSVKVKKVQKLNDDIQPLNEGEKQEAVNLISSIRKKKISDQTVEDLDDYERDIKDNEIRKMDLRYLRSLNARLE